MTIARVRIGSLDTDASALGFGCGSLGSRIAPAAGLAALARAYDAGVTWFDVAPSYGDGHAEILLGQFLAGCRRDSIQILTKVGIDPPVPSLRAQLLRPAMRLAVATLPGLRAAVRRHRPRATKCRLEAGLIRQSLEASLRRLGTDYVDVLALHDATPEEAARDDVIAALDNALASGKARSVAVASSPEAAASGVTAGSCYGLVQMGNNLSEQGLSRFRAAGNWSVDVVTHSVFGNDALIARVAARIATDADLQHQLSAANYEGTALRMAADLLADFAFIDNPGGIVLISMFDERHLRHNLARHALPRNAATIRSLSTAIGTASR